MSGHSLRLFLDKLKSLIDGKIENTRHFKGADTRVGWGYGHHDPASSA